MASAAHVPIDSMTPVWPRPATITNRPMKKTSTDHSTSARTSDTSTRDTSSITPAPTRATIDGSTCTTECSVNPMMTRPSTIRQRTSRFASVIALRSSSDITSATYCSL